MVPTSNTWSDDEVAAALDMDTAITSQRRAFEALASGDAQLAEKVSLPHANSNDATLCYVSKLSPSHGVVSKLVAVNPGNVDRGLPSITATVLVLDNTTGQLIATLDATAMTGIRTAAGSAVAADALAPSDADELAVLGSGVQARSHVRAISRVRRLRTVRIFSPHPGHRESAATDLSSELGIDVHAVETASDAVRDAAVVSTCTLSAEPVVATSDLAPGATVLSVGSFTHDRREVDADLARLAHRVVVDDPGTAAEHAGPIVHAIESGVLSKSDLVPLGQVLLGHSPGRSSDDDLVFFNSVGLGVQDAAAAHAVLGTLA